MTLDDLASTAATAYGLRWVSLQPADKQAWLRVARAVRDKIKNPDTAMLNAATHGYRYENEINLRAMVGSIR